MNAIITAEVSPDTDYVGLARAERRFAEYTNKYDTPSFTNENEYRSMRLGDMERFNELARQYLGAGLRRQGRRFANFQSLNQLAAALGMPGSVIWPPADLERVLLPIPILHRASNGGDPSPPGEVVTVLVPHALPAIESSALGGWLRAMCTLLVRRTYYSPGRDQLILRDDAYLLPRLQMHARAFIWLIGRMFSGDNLRVPSIDGETQWLLDYANGGAAQVTEGAAIGCLVTGYAYFEVLHEFCHVIAGDWLKDTLTVEDEIVADQFAAMCLLSGQHELPAAKVYALRGAHIFLALLGIAEFLFEKTDSHPGANARCEALWDYARSNLSTHELAFFDKLDDLEALVAFCYTPSKFGGVTPDGLIDRFGDPTWPDPFDSIGSM